MLLEECLCCKMYNAGIAPDFLDDFLWEIENFVKFLKRTYNMPSNNWLDSRVPKDGIYFSNLIDNVIREGMKREIVRMIKTRFGKNVRISRIKEKSVGFDIFLDKNVILSFFIDITSDNVEYDVSLCCYYFYIATYKKCISGIKNIKRFLETYYYYERDKDIYICEYEYKYKKEYVDDCVKKVEDNLKMECREIVKKRRKGCKGRGYEINVDNDICYKEHSVLKRSLYE